MLEPIESSSYVRENYALKFVSNLTGIRCNEVNKEYCNLLFDRLTLSHEIESKARDIFNNFEWYFDDSHFKGQLYLPYLDVVFAELRKYIIKRYPDINPEPTWPNGKKFAICLSHDVDEVTDRASWSKILHRIDRTIKSKPEFKKIAEQSLYSIGRIYRKLKHQGIDPLWHYEDWLKLEDTYGFKSTFFFFPSKIDRPHYYDCAYDFSDKIVYDGREMSVKEMAIEIDRAGWEVGLHTSYNSATNLTLLQSQRDRVSTSIGNDIYSVRQHFLRYDPEITPPLHAKAGFHSDSTHGYNFAVGFRAGTSFPYWTWDWENNNELPVLEVPLSIMDSSLFNPSLYHYDEERAIKHCLHIMDNVEAVGGCLTLSWHPNYLNNQSWWNVYKTLLEEARHRNAWGCSVGEIHDWWVKREQKIQSRSVCPESNIDTAINDFLNRSLE